MDDVGLAPYRLYIAACMADGCKGCTCKTTNVKLWSWASLCPIWQAPGEQRGETKFRRKFFAKLSFKKAGGFNLGGQLHKIAH